MVKTVAPYRQLSGSARKTGFVEVCTKCCLPQHDEKFSLFGRNLVYFSAVFFRDSFFHKSK
jgi:hypothetical protein